MNPLEVYEKSVQAVYSKGLDREKCKEEARNAMKAAFPGMVITAKIANGMVHIMNKYYGRNVQLAKQPEVKSKKAVQDDFLADNKSFMDAMRECAELGFIPSGKYLAPFIGKEKAKQIPTYNNLLEDEGYVIEQNDHNERGYIVSVSKERQEIHKIETEIEALKKRLDQLKR